MSKIEKRIAELGLELPEAPSPMANYVTARRSGNQLYFSGAGPFQNKKPAVFGKVGSDLTLEEGYQAARLTGLNLLSQLKMRWTIWTRFVSSKCWRLWPLLRTSCSSPP